MALCRKLIPIVLAIAVAATMTFVAVTPAGAQPTEVWVDDDWAGSSPGDIMDGHIFGTDAFAIIQDGIDAVASPGIVHVAVGTYYENITLKDGVQLLGAGADVTTIDGGGSGSVVTAIGVGPDTVLEGFTITNGNDGGISINNSSPTIANNIISDNSGCGAGGIAVGGSSPTIKGNTLTRNQATCGPNVGTAIHVSGSSSPVIVNNVMFDHPGGWLGSSVVVMSLAAGSYPIVTNNTIVNNDNSGVLVQYYGGATVIRNNTIADNSGYGIYCDWYETPQISFNDVWNNSSGNYGGSLCPDQTGVNGNLSADPMFVDPDGGDYHLQAGSPSIDAGTNDGAPAEDIEGNPRPIDGDGDGTATTDMGAYEYVPSAPHMVPAISLWGGLATVAILGLLIVYMVRRRQTAPKT